MPIYRCENVGCKSKGAVVFLPVMPIPLCQVCKGHMVPASKHVETKVGGAHTAPTVSVPVLKAVPETQKNTYKPTSDPLKGQLQTKVTHKINVATIDENKTQVMNGATMALKVKYRFWISDHSKQSKEVTIEIPIYVHGPATAATFWASKGYAPQALTRTAHPISTNPAIPSGKPGVNVVALTEDAKKAWTAKINKCWGAAGVLHHSTSGPQIYKLKFVFRFVDDPADAAAEVICVKCTGEAAAIQGANSTIDAIRWGIDDTDLNTIGPICHEVGHLIGNPDEYYDVTFDGQTRSWGDGYQAGDEYGIMNNPDHPPLVRNYRYMAKKLIDKFGIPASEADVILDIAMPNTCPRRNLALSLWD